jgi:hypothetical protein
MSRVAFGVTKESKSSSDYLVSKKKVKCYQSKPLHKNEYYTNRLAVNLITKLDLAFIEVVDDNGNIDPNGSMFGNKPCEKHNYLRFLIAL